MSRQTWRIRHDKVNRGTVTLRYAGKLIHLGIGKAHKHQQVLILIHANNTITINKRTGEILAEHLIDPDKNYQPKVNDVPTHTVNDDPTHQPQKRQQ